MKPVRITIRLLLVATAMVALMSRGYLLWLRSMTFFEIAAKHNNERITAEVNLLDSKDRKFLYDIKNQYVFQPQIDGFTKRFEYEKSMYRKYRFAALHPWIAVDADPPVPDEAPGLLPVR